MRRRMRVSILVAWAVVFGVGDGNTQAQAQNPIVGGVWDRYSLMNPQGVVSGSPGWFFLTFTSDGYFFATGVQKGKEKLPKPAKEMTKEELVGHLQGISLRRGTYTLTGNGSPYTLTLADEADPLSTSTQSSCNPSAPCELRMMENGEVRLFWPQAGNTASWRRVAPAGRR